jgi:hypothetical protein
MNDELIRAADLLQHRYREIPRPRCEWKFFERSNDSLAPSDTAAQCNHACGWICVVSVSDRQIEEEGDVRAALLTVLLAEF